MWEEILGNFGLGSGCRNFVFRSYERPIHLQVETVFHEFGHALQHMLTKQDEGLVAGIRGIEWDAVELPSQFMENWCYHR